MSSGTQSFVIALAVVIGSFSYFLASLLSGRPTDPVIVPIIGAAIGMSLSFFLSGHIANGAASRAADALVVADKLRAAQLVSAAADVPRPPAG